MAPRPPRTRPAEPAAGGRIGSGHRQHGAGLSTRTVRARPAAPQLEFVSAGRSARWPGPPRPETVRPVAPDAHIGSHTPRVRPPAVGTAFQECRTDPASVGSRYGPATGRGVPVSTKRPGVLVTVVTSRRCQAGPCAPDCPTAGRVNGAVAGQVILAAGSAPPRPDRLDRRGCRGRQPAKVMYSR